MPNAFDSTWLAIDASTYGGTVAVGRGRDVLATREVAMRGEREERLMPAVVDALGTAGVAPLQLGAVICGEGPGSFTSLRIAASIAKGIAQAAQCPLYAAPSLALLDASPGTVTVAFDALRGDAYAASITRDAGGGVIAYDYLGVVAASSISGGLTAATPQARAVLSVATLLDARGPVDLDAWEPNYGRKAEAQVKWEAAHGRELPNEVAPA